MTHYPVPLTPDQAAVYTIVIQGQVAENWLGYFDGFEVEITGKGRSAITTISCYLVDQAALQGILQHLYALGVVLLRVEREERP